MRDEPTVGDRVRLGGPRKDGWPALSSAHSSTRMAYNVYKYRSAVAMRFDFYIFICFTPNLFGSRSTESWVVLPFYCIHSQIRLTDGKHTTLAIRELDVILFTIKIHACSFAHLSANVGKITFLVLSLLALYGRHSKHITYYFHPQGLNSFWCW